MLFRHHVRVTMKKVFRKAICVCIIATMTLSCAMVSYAGENEPPLELSTQENTMMIEGEMYTLVPESVVRLNNPDIPMRDQQHYDWKKGAVNKSNKHLNAITVKAVTAAITALLGQVSTTAAEIAAMAKIAVDYYANKNINSANIYYTTDHYYAQNLGGYGGYPYYCKKVLYQYKDKARTIALYDRPVIGYYYAYQPY